MSSFEVDTCFGCGANIEPAPGNYYCTTCIERQEQAHKQEQQAFEDYHAYADMCARASQATYPKTQKGNR